MSSRSEFMAFLNPPTRHFRKAFFPFYCKMCALCYITNLQTDGAYEWIFCNTARYIHMFKLLQYIQYCDHVPFTPFQAFLPSSLRRRNFLFSHFISFSTYFNVYVIWKIFLALLYWMEDRENAEKHFLLFTSPWMRLLLATWKLLWDAMSLAFLVLFWHIFRWKWGASWMSWKASEGWKIVKNCWWSFK